VPSKAKPEPASPPTVRAIAQRAPDDAERSAPKRARNRRIARDPKVGQVQERPPGTAAVDLAKTESERCEIGWWRGYLKSDFYAAVVTAGGDSYVVARSPLFRWRHSAPPTQIDHVVAAHRALLGQLEREGWEYEGRGDQWYAARFRLVLGPHSLRVGGHATRES
jgi:hypothetical protein